MKWNKKVVLWIAMLLVVAALVYGQSLQVKASARPSASEIPDGTLVIGTHLIAFQALNQEIIDIALKSADDMHKREDEIYQDRVYYKSDINRGVWYDITNAEAIGDITLSTSMVVADSVIDGLILTHWTKSDGITIELSTGKEVKSHLIGSPEDPNNLSELELLQIEKDVQAGKLKALLESKKEGSGGDEDEVDTDLEKQIEATRLKIASIDRIFEPITDAQIDNANQLLDAYDDFIKQLINDKKAPESLMLIASEEKAKALAERDLLIYEIMVERVNDETIEASMLEDAELLGRYGTTIDELSQTLTQLQIAVDKGEQEPMLLQMTAKLAEELSNQIRAGNQPGAYEEILKMQAIDSIHNNRILNRQLELEILLEAMGDLAATLEEQLASGETDEYKQAKQNGESVPVLEGIKKSVLDDKKQKLQELDELLDYKLFRLDPKLGIQAVEDLLGQLLAAQENLADDDLKKDLFDLIDSHIVENRLKLAKMKADQSPEVAKQVAQMEQLRALEGKLQEEFYAAAESGAFDDMQRLKEQLNSVDQKLEAELSKAAETYKDLLDKKVKLQDHLAKADNDSDKNKLRQELDQVLTQLAGLELILDEKSKNSLQDLGDLQKELATALNNDDLREAANVAIELVNLIAIIPDSLMSDEQKSKMVDDILEQLDDKAEQYDRSGNSGAAANMTSMADAVNNLAANKGLFDIGPSITQPTIASPYSIVFADQKVYIREPYQDRNGSIYVPSRRIFEALGAKVTWQPEREHIIVQDPSMGLLVEYSLKSDIIYLNNRRIRLEKPVESIRGDTFIPLQIILDGYRLRSEMRDGVIYAHRR